MGHCKKERNMDTTKDNIQVHVDSETAAMATAIFNRLGLTMTDAINIFLRRTVVEGGLPLSLKLTDDELEELEFDNVVGQLPVISDPKEAMRLLAEDD